MDDNMNNYRDPVDEIVLGESFVKADMESALLSRDRVGVQDFVLLEDYKSTTAFVENLKKRFHQNLIYTYIGPVLVSVNPYKNLNIYNEKVIETYKNVNFYELPPHIFAIADVAYRSMRSEYEDQCVLISGESGAGKTEASKKILQYIAQSSTHSVDVDRVKDRLLQSNPILEAFGNAKTNRNDNSSRFGKYMDIQFNFKGSPVGGHIINYLLEKSRVCHQGLGDRNFHVFYQLVKGCENDFLKKFEIGRRVDMYYYLNQGNCNDVESIDDQTGWEVLREACDVCDFSGQEQEHLFSIVASVLHLGNLCFTEDSGHAKLLDTAPVKSISKLLGCSPDELVAGLTHKSINVQEGRVSTPLSRDQALYARDALAKGIYERMFTWIVNKINKSLANEGAEKKTLMGLLDIYGFEIFESNSFEQFCINYCNEKLQQLFIELTLKSEQEEYLKEGIEWEPVQFFNNKIICDLVEARPVGIICLLDEECLRPGEATDVTLLDKMSKTLGTHPHFLSHSTALDFTVRRTLARDEFRLLHYAGEVTYSAKGFLDKNNDRLYRDLKQMLSQATNPVAAKCFPESELTSKKRPETASTQFKTSLQQLMEILMSKQPSYVRCIKPNEEKRPNSFNEKIVKHQVKYLGLMENLRVRRAGFAYRRSYEVFLKRYKPLCPDTWPSYHGPAKEGVRILCQHLRYEEEDFKLGKSKLFIRFPRVLFATEDALQHKKNELAVIIQSKYRCHYQRRKYLRMQAAVTRLACMWRVYQARQRLQKRKWAASVIRKFIKGFIRRKDPPCDDNVAFIRYTRYNYLTRLKAQLPKTVLDKSWPDSPELLKKTSELLRDLNMRNLVQRYCKHISSDMKWQMQQKVVAETLFKGKKQSYPSSIRELFTDSRLATHHDSLRRNIFDVQLKPENEKTLYSATVIKYDRNGYHARPRVMFVTNAGIYIVQEKDFKLKDKIPFLNLSGISVSGLTDGIFVLHATAEHNHGSKDKGDLILRTDYVIESVTKIAMAADRTEALTVASNNVITHYLASGREGHIEFSSGNKYAVNKGKNGQLFVMAPPVYG